MRTREAESGDEMKLCDECEKRQLKEANNYLENIRNNNYMAIFKGYPLDQLSREAVEGLAILLLKETNVREEIKCECL